MTDYALSPEFVLSTAYGPVIVTLSGGDYAYCKVGDEQGPAHINDDRPCFTFKGQEYIGYVALRSQPDHHGIWEIDQTRYGFSKRPQWTEAPPTYRTAMAESVLTAVKGHLYHNPHLTKIAENANTQRAFSQAERLLAEAREAERLAQQEVYRLRALLSEAGPRVSLA